MVYEIPTPSDAILTALKAAAITEEDATRYFDNYTTFVKHRIEIREDLDGEWVAALNGRIEHAPTYEQLMDMIRWQPNWERAYYEHVGRI